MFLSKSKRRPRSTPVSQLTRIQATKGWGSLKLDELWRYRDLIYFLLWREIVARYKQMALGPLWLVIQPLFLITMNTLVFGTLAKLPSDGIPYPLFNFAGVLPWQFFAGALARVSGSLANNQQLITKVYFPRLVMPIVGALSGVLDFLVSLGLFLIIMPLYQFFPGINVLAIPFLLIFAGAIALAVGLWLASLQARFRDVGFMLSYILQAWMYATPVVYASSIIPEQWQFVYRLNPMTTVVEGFRWALLGNGTLQWLPSLISVAIVLILLVTGAYVFRRSERTIVDVV
ncbi:ABC transporter permease [Pseudanabaena sp. PCC 6802]|uniref:ABC transporter permease n=1 Tax=Pseudanabaena sp. PCC 6802 TaxID=118173 RepID=UPI0003463F50|nr:ABC transporter permease [Pseudanabaena sp. PCC 6802]